VDLEIIGLELKAPLSHSLLECSDVISFTLLFRSIAALLLGCFARILKNPSSALAGSPVIRTNIFTQITGEYVRVVLKLSDTYVGNNKERGKKY